MRLTQQVRDSIMRKIVSERINPELEKVWKRIKEKAQYLADNKYPESVQKWIDEAPEGGLSVMQDPVLYVILPGEQKKKEVRFSILKKFFGSGRVYYVMHVPLSRPIKVLEKDRQKRELVLSTKKDIEWYKRIEKRLEVLEEAKKDIEKTIGAALGSCNTYKQVQDRYPELAKYLPKVQSKSTALVVPRDKVVEALHKS